MKRWLCALLLACCAGSVPAAEAAPPAGRVMVMLRLPPPHFRADTMYAGTYRNDGGHSARRRIALDLARQHGLTLVSDWPMPALGLDCYVLAIPPDADAVRLAELLSGDARVEWAQAVGSFRGLGLADPLYLVQPGARAWHLDELHRVSTGARVLVAVIDSGVDLRHPDLDGQVAVSENFIDGSPYLAENHGTAVAAIIGAREGHGGILGVAPAARLMALRACRELPDHATQCDSFSLGKALNFAIMRATRVINLSLSGPPDRLLARLLDVAAAHGIKVVAASDPQQSDGGFPASWPGVFSVGDEGAHAAFSAPGRDIPTAVPGARWGFVSGASFAAAHVSGLLALLTEIEPGASASRMRAELDSGAAGVRTVGAAGRSIDACAAVATAAARCVCACAPVAGLKAMRAP